nr:MAG TPA: hypothetical protein [Caudoviricetes sp.]
MYSFRLSCLLIFVNPTSKFIRLSSSHRVEVSIIVNLTTQLRVVKQSFSVLSL